jgi:hypothetical protein
MWFDSRYSSARDLTSSNLAQHFDLEQSSSTSSTESTASTTQSGKSSMATRGGNILGIQPSGRAFPARGGKGVAKKGVDDHTVVGKVRESTTKSKKKRLPTRKEDMDDDEE